MKHLVLILPGLCAALPLLTCVSYGSAPLQENTPAIAQADPVKEVRKAVAQMLILLVRDQFLYPEDPSKMRTLAILSSIDQSGFPQDFRQEYAKLIAAITSMNDQNCEELSFLDYVLALPSCQKYKVSPLEQAFKIFHSPELSEFRKINVEKLSPSDQETISTFLSLYLEKTLNDIEKCDPQQYEQQFLERSAEAKKAFDLMLNLMMDHLIDQARDNDPVEWQAFLAKQDLSAWPEPMAASLKQSILEFDGKTGRAVMKRIIARLDETSAIHYGASFDDIIDCCQEGETGKKINSILSEKDPNMEELQQLVEQLKKEILEKYTDGEKIIFSLFEEPRDFPR